MTTASPPTKPPLPLGNKLLFSADHIGLQAIGYPRQQWVLFFLAPPALEGISRVPDVSLVGLNIDARVLAGLSTRLPAPSSVGGATAPAAGGGVAYPSSCSARRFMLCSRGWFGFTRCGQQLAERAVLRANAGTIFHGGHYVKRRAGDPGAGTDSYRQRPDERGQLHIPFRGRRDRATARTCTMGG